MAGMFQGYQNPADAAAEADIAQRLQQAALLRQRATAMPGEVGGVSVTPNAIGLGARALSAILGKRQQQQAIEQATQYGDQRRQRLMKAVQGAGMAKTPDEMQAAGVAMMGEDPAAGMQMVRQAAQMRQQAAQAQAQMERETARYAQMDQRQRAMFEHQEAMRREAERAADERQQAQLAAIAARQGGSGPDPYYQALQGIGPDGKPIFYNFNARTGQMEQIQLPQGAVTPAAMDEDTKRRLAAAGALGKEGGSAEARALTAEAQQPQLEESVNQLGDLADTASFTKLDQAYNWLRRQAGAEATQGSVDREKYLSIVDNQILPILRSTFGAQFTQKEGEWLRETLGSADKSPMEKEATLRGFIETKRRTLETMKREAALMNGRQASPAAPSAAPAAAAPNSDDDLINKYLRQ